MALDKKTIRIIALSATAVVVILATALVYIGVERRSLHTERTAFAELEKERMEEELRQLHTDYGVQLEKIRTGTGYGEQYQHLSSDSLLEQLGREKAKAERLADELRMTKASDAKKINALSAEVTSLRKVLRSYVVQIDSLERANQALRQENEKVRKEYTEASQRAGKLANEKAALSSQVTRAARLELKGVSCTPLDKHGRNTNKLSRMTHLRFDFTVARNITADPGLRRVYIRLLNPNDMPIASSGGGDFLYEGSDLQATASKEIEYGGEDLPVNVFWSVDQTLLSGKYRADFFIEGELCGRLTFVLD